MTVTLEKVVPFGRSLDEYIKMFSLTDADLAGRIIGVADGPASFNAEMSARGRRVVSVDPIYGFSAAEIEKQFYAVVDNIISQVKSTPNDWTWEYHKSPEHLRENRVAALRKFLTDYETGRKGGRYVLGELPDLDFTAGQFDLAICSHFLFLYSDHLSADFHRAGVIEMLRVAREVRIFPLLTHSLQKSAHLPPLLTHLNSSGFTATIEKVEYEFQKGGDEMLRIRNRA